MTVLSIDLIASAFTNPHYAKLFSGTSTHDAALATVNRMIRHTQDEGLITRIIASGLPLNYEGNTLKEVSEMITSAIEKGIGEPKTAKTKPSPAELLVSTALAAGAVLFHDRHHNAYICVPLELDAMATYSLAGSKAGWWLKKLFHDKHGKIIASQAFKDALDQLQSMAVLSGLLEKISLRIAGDGERIDIDLGQPDHAVVSITKEGWNIEPCSDHKFYRSSGFGALPVPSGGGSLIQLKELLNLDAENWTLLLAFLVNCLKPDGPYMCLLVEGEQGSGKSFLCSLIKRIIDPNETEKMRLPDNARDLFIHAKEFFLLHYDNTSGMKAEMSDVLCTLATGGGHATRRLYKDDELASLNYCRPFIINGISDYANRPDLLERAIPLQLPTLPAGKRKTERLLKAEFEKMLPSILGELYSIVAHALANFDKVEPPTNIRMADCAQWLVAAEGAADLPQGSFLKVLGASQADAMVERVINLPLVIAIQKLIERESYNGLMGDLFSKLSGGGEGRHLPPTPAHLSKELKRLRPALEKAGIHIDLGSKKRSGKPVHIWRDGQHNLVPTPIY